MVTLKEFEPSEIESKVENIERELLVIKLVLRRRKEKKVRLNNLISRINEHIIQDLDTTSLIREMRDRSYA
jgi:hypothetical protein